MQVRFTTHPDDELTQNVNTWSLTNDSKSFPQQHAHDRATIHVHDRATFQRMTAQRFQCTAAGSLHARESLRCHATRSLHACKLLSAVRWNRCAVMRLNRCAVMRVWFWERFGIVRQARRVDILTELVVGMCREESYSENHYCLRARHC